MRELDGVSNEAVLKATGRGWKEWLAILDKAGAKQWDHRQIVAYLKETHDISSWWQQSVTVAYEKAKGKRVLGQTADAGFQLGVQRTLPLSTAAAWKFLTSKPAIACWLGSVQRFSLSEGKKFNTASGVEGEIRVVKPEDRVRLTWKRAQMQRHATLQIALMKTTGDKTAVRFHMERLSSQRQRQEMLSHWKQVLEKLVKMAAAGQNGRSKPAARRKSVKT